MNYVERFRNVTCLCCWLSLGLLGFFTVSVNASTSTGTLYVYITNSSGCTYNASMPGYPYRLYFQRYGCVSAEAVVGPGFDGIALTFGSFVVTNAVYSNSLSSAYCTGSSTNGLDQENHYWLEDSRGNRLLTNYELSHLEPPTSAAGTVMTYRIEGSCAPTNYVICTKVTNLEQYRRLFYFEQGEVIFAGTEVPVGQTKTLCVTVTTTNGLILKSTSLYYEDGGLYPELSANFGETPVVIQTNNFTVESQAPTGSSGNPTNTNTFFNPTGSYYVAGTNGGILFTNVTATNAIASQQAGDNAIYDALTKFAKSSHDDMERLGTLLKTNIVQTSGEGGTNNISVTNSVSVTFTNNGLNSSTFGDPEYTNYVGNAKLNFSSKYAEAGGATNAAQAKANAQLQYASISGDIDIVSGVLTSIPVISDDTTTDVTDYFKIQIPVPGQSIPFEINCDPAEYPQAVAAIAIFKRTVGWLISLLYAWTIWKDTRKYVSDMFTVQQVQVPTSVDALGINYGWMSYALYISIFMSAIGLVPIGAAIWINGSGGPYVADLLGPIPIAISEVTHPSIGVAFYLLYMCFPVSLAITSLVSYFVYRASMDAISTGAKLMVKMMFRG